MQRSSHDDDDGEKKKENPEHPNHQLSASYRESRPLLVVVVSKSRTLEARRSPKTEVVNYFSLGADPRTDVSAHDPSGVRALCVVAIFNAHSRHRRRLLQHSLPHESAGPHISR